MVSPEAVLETFLAGALEDHRCLAYWADYAATARGCKVKMALVEVARRWDASPTLSPDLQKPIFSFLSCHLLITSLCPSPDLLLTIS